MESVDDVTVTVGETTIAQNQISQRHDLVVTRKEDENGAWQRESEDGKNKNIITLVLYKIKRQFEIQDYCLHNRKAYEEMRQ